MTSVFLSYDRDDTHVARAIALGLERAGHSVWWDLNVRGGAQFSKVIDEALKAADAVVVLWSKNSIESAWVRDEASAGRDSGRLIPATIDGTEAPLGFRQFQTIDCTDWKRGVKSRGYNALEGAIVQLGVPDHRSTGLSPVEQRSAQQPNRRTVSALAVGALLAIAAAGFWWLGKPASGEVQSVAVVASDSTSSSLARELLVDLGNLQSAKSGSIRLLADNGASARSADLIFETAGDPGPDRASANLLLTSGKDKSVLWSKDFVQDTGNVADLKQQMAFTAARVLGCALDANGSEDRLLDPQTTKIYLNACAELSEIGAADASSVIPTLLKVTRDAPRFEGGWAKLLIAEAQSLNPTRGSDQEARLVLQQHIEASGKVDPQMPEIAIAEAAELGNGAYKQQDELLARAKSSHPDNSNLLGTRSFYLMDVGRMREATEDARHAVELDPLSPLQRNAYISTLMYSGRIDAAREELQTAMRLWPGTETVREIQFRFNLRYGDPKAAEQFMTDRGGPALALYLTARMRPTPDNVDRVTSYLPPRDVHNLPVLANLIQAMGEFHREDQLFALLTQPIHRADLENHTATFFRPALKKFRQDPRFMQIAKLAGLLDYWRTSGKWPDFCFEPDLSYDCKKEAAKLNA